MSWLLRWCSRQVTGWKLVGFLTIMTLVDVTLSIAVMATMVYGLHIDLPDTATFRMPMTAWPTFPLALGIMAVEEFIFRFAPLSLAVTAWGHSQKVLVVSLLSAILFGLWHGSYLHIFAQGAGGFIYCLMFLKTGGFDQRFLRAGAICLFAHTLYNALIASLSAMSGESTIAVRLPVDWPVLVSLSAVLGLVLIWAVLFRTFTRTESLPAN